ncbi:hypothetical protein CULT_370042 [[Clostridium] ultunense Esp]|nr:hypothetical protein CULT_370042 [[Clostridium] ultunense Esp]
MFRYKPDQESQDEDNEKRKTNKKRALIFPATEPKSRHNTLRLRPIAFIDRPIFYVWEGAAEEEKKHVKYLADLAKDVAYLGTTWSSVSVRVVEKIEEIYKNSTYLKPIDTREVNKIGVSMVETIRVPKAGRLKRLDQEFERVNRSILALKRSNKYELPMKTYLGSSNTPYVWVIEKNASEGNSLSRAAYARLQILPSIPDTWVGVLSQAIHAIMARATDGLNSVFSVDVEGYATGNHAYKNAPHVGIAPLIHAGFPYADGRIRGVLLYFPESKDIDKKAIEAIYNVFLNELYQMDNEIRIQPSDFTSYIKNAKGTIVAIQDIAWVMQPIDEKPIFSYSMADETLLYAKKVKETSPVMRTLDLRRWKTKSRKWASITPVILPKHPRRKLTAADILNQHAEMLGLPKIKHVTFSQESIYKHVSNITLFSHMATRYTESPWTHVFIEFVKPVYGPVLLGKGMYFGYGMFAPVFDREESENE